MAGEAPGHIAVPTRRAPINIAPCGPVAQMVEPRTHNPPDGGSTPPRPTLRRDAALPSASRPVTPWALPPAVAGAHPRLSRRVEEGDAMWSSSHSRCSISPGDHERVGSVRRQAWGGLSRSARCWNAAVASASRTRSSRYQRIGTRQPCGLGDSASGAPSKVARSVSVQPRWRRRSPALMSRCAGAPSTPSTVVAV